MKSLEQIIIPIADELAQFKAFFEQSLKADTEPMDTIMQYVTVTKGKRLRPILVLLSAKLFGKVNEQTLRAATFVEMVHSATLIHDDVVDDSDLRRDQASVKAHFGNLSAVLAGDYLLAKAMLLLSNLKDIHILNEMLRTTAAMSEGELMQNVSVRPLSPKLPEPVEGSKGHPNNFYLDIITRKTAMLMRSCCAAGARSVGATEQQIQQISDFGLNFGILFQLRDDMLDGEHTVEARALLPTYLKQALASLNVFPASETLEALRDLTVFCAERDR